MKSISSERETKGTILGNKSSNIIEINGKRYDAVSGSLLDTSPAQSASASTAGGYSIDGFRRTHGQSTHTDLTAMAEKAQQVKAARKAHATAAHATAHRPEPAKTLMRSAVKMPDLKPSKAIKVQSRADSAVSIPTHEIAPKLSVAAIDPIRQKRADRIIQSPAVSRFGRTSGIDAIAPYSPSLHLTTASARTISASTADALPFISVAEQQRTDAAPQPDIFARAIASASTDAGTSSNQQKYSSKRATKKGRLAIATSVSLVFLLVIGIFAYANIPAISLRMASARAGFQAKLPSYSPAGFNFRTLSYGPGNVTVSYTSNLAGLGSGGTKQFTIEQHESGWDNNALLNNFVASANKAYQTYQRAGHTVYLYGDGNTATWVSNGIWYTVDGGNSLSRSQLLQLASSL